VNSYYNLYIENVYSLAETISVKFEDAANALNLGVILKHGIDSVSTDPYSWKYYQNISGAYHFSDTRMMIISLDTLAEIEFNLTNLALHPGTKEAYQFGKRYYRELVQKYPDQESLILGILYPADITTAVESKDGTILTYPKNLVDSNEYTFIEKLQKWIYNYTDRWVNRQYAISDDLYTATYLGQFYLHLVPAIINIRLQACKTNEAHSFHIQQYLASHEMLDKYIESMTKEQCLFFYRNILYIERNSGKKDTFDWLVDNLMTKRALPLYEYTMKHDVSKMLPSIRNGNSVNYYPEITFRKNPINFVNTEAAKEFLSLNQVKSKLNRTTSGNLEYQKENADQIRQTLEDSKSNVVSTKLLESSLVDYTQSSPELFTDVLLHHWAYWCSLNKYNAFVSITLPKSKKVIQLSVKNVFILLVYTLNRSVGIQLNTVPDVLALNVLQNPLPNISVLRNCTQTKYISDELITQLYNTAPNIVPVGSVDLFYNQCKLVYNSIQQQYVIQSSAEHLTACGELKMATAKLYADVKIKLSPTELVYSTWLDNLGIDFYEYNDNEFNDFSLTLVSQATGLINNKSVSLKQIQKSMIEMLTLLSSYSIQIISDVSQPSINLVNGTSVRIGDIAETEGTHTYLDENRFDIVGSTGAESNNVKLDLNIIYPINVAGGADNDSEHIEIGVNVYNDVPIVELVPVKVKIPNFTILDITTIIPTPIPGGEFNATRITNLPITLSSNNHSFYTDGIAVIPLSLGSNNNSFYTELIGSAPVSLNTQNSSFYSENITSIPINLNGATPYIKAINLVPVNLNSGINNLLSPITINLPLGLTNSDNNLLSPVINNIPFSLSNGINNLATPFVTTVPIGLTGPAEVEILEYFTSVLYPLLVEDTLTINAPTIPLNAGYLLEGPNDSLQVNSSIPLDGTLVDTIVYKTANTSGDSLSTGSSIPLDGTLVDTIVYKTANTSGDSLSTGSSIPLDGTLNVTIAYFSVNIEGDSLQVNSSIPLSGTLI
jgi:hypothetical protein